MLTATQQSVADKYTLSETIRDLIVETVIEWLRDARFGRSKCSQSRDP